MSEYNKKSGHYMGALQKWKIIALLGMCSIMPALQ